jgi:hypothetical protein
MIALLAIAVLLALVVFLGLSCYGLATEVARYRAAAAVDQGGLAVPPDAIAELPRLRPAWVYYDLATDSLRYIPTS